MARQMNCPTCGIRHSVNQSCWSCAYAAEEEDLNKSKAQLMMGMALDDCKTVDDLKKWLFEYVVKPE